MRPLILTLLTAGLAFGQADTSFLPQDYRCGISIRYSGTSGVDYLAEPHYYEPLHENRQTVYIKSTTLISMFHNEINSLSKAPEAAGLLPDGRPYKTNNLTITGAAGPDRILGNEDDGTIRYQFDGDGGALNVFAVDPTETVKRLLPAYTAPFSLSTRTYNFNTVPVVGTTGTNGVPITDRFSHYQYGLLDSAGDEWHSLIIGDDDSYYGFYAPEDRDYKEDVWASDGKMQMLVVNPKAPCVTVTKTGDAQFYTTPAHVYWIPKINAQTTYIQPGTGTVSITLTDINNNIVYCRLNGGSWTNNGTKTITLADSDFSTGSTLLETYYAGNPTNIRKRTIVKNPTFPSAAETHGHLMWGNQTNLDKIVNRRATGRYLSFWNKLQGRSETTQSMYDDYGGRGFRRWIKGEMVTSPGILENAFTAKVLGNDAVATGSTLSFAEYGKRMLLDSALSIDPIHSELDSNQYPGPYGEFKGPGYNIMNTMFSYIPGYDVLIANYRSDQHANGITPIQDYFIRDQIAKVCLRALSYMRGTSAPELWSFPYQTAAWMAGVCMPTYDTPYYGTSGYDGVHTTAALYTPYPTLPETWKHAITDLTPAAGTYPNRIWVYVPTSNETGLLSHNVTSYGYWAGDNIGYYNLSRKSYEIISNLSKLHGIAPDEWGAIDQSWLYGAQGTMKNFLGRGTNATTGFAATTTSGSAFVGTTESLRDALQDGQTLYGIGIPELATIVRRTPDNSVPAGFTMNLPATASGSTTIQAMWYFTHEAVMNDWHPDFAATGRQAMLNRGILADLSNIRKWLWYDDGGAPPVATVLNPSISPAGGTYNGTQTVTLATGTSGATIRYTTNGTAPTSSTGTVYTVPFAVSATATVKAIAYKSGSSDSAVTNAAYTINPDIIIAPPVVGPAPRVQGGAKVAKDGGKFNR